MRALFLNKKIKMTDSIDYSNLANKTTIQMAREFEPKPTVTFQTARLYDPNEIQIYVRVKDKKAKSPTGVLDFHGKGGNKGK